MNKIIEMGRLTKDPQVTYTAAKTAVARFTLAVDRAFKKEGDEQTADFIPCVAWGKTAEFLEKYCKKGTKLAVEGSLRSGNYKNKDGQTVYTLDVNVERVEFAESKGSGSGSEVASEIPSPEGFEVAAEEALPFA